VTGALRHPLPPIGVVGPFDCESRVTCEKERVASGAIVHIHERSRHLANKGTESPVQRGKVTGCGSNPAVTARKHWITG